MVADDYLILAAALHDSDYPAHFLEHIVIGNALILQLKAKPCDTVRKTDHVLFAAHVSDDLFCKFFILTHFSFPPLFRAGMQGAVFFYNEGLANSMSPP